MAIEIERKFLLANDDWRREVVRSQPMEQAYLGGERASIRIRREGDRALLNIKSREKGCQRLEFEYEVPLADAEQMLDALVMPGRVSKTRHYVERDGLVWEIDEFHGDNAGLRVAEVELEAVDQPLPRPAWLGVEVTDCLRYYNNSLSQRPFGQWTADEQKGPSC